MSREAAAAALTAYSARVGLHEQHEPEAWQASDLMTDVLLMFDPNTADGILHRVQRDFAAEQPDVQPAFPPAD